MICFPQPKIALMGAIRSWLRCPVRQRRLTRWLPAIVFPLSEMKTTENSICLPTCRHLHLIFPYLLCWNMSQAFQFWWSPLQWQDIYYGQWDANGSSIHSFQIQPLQTKGRGFSMKNVLWLIIEFLSCAWNKANWTNNYVKDHRNFGSLAWRVSDPGKFSLMFDLTHFEDQAQPGCPGELTRTHVGSGRKNFDGVWELTISFLDSKPNVTSMK